MPTQSFMPEGLAQLRQSETWTNVRGVTRAVDDIGVRYAKNILGFLRARRGLFIKQALVYECATIDRGWDGVTTSPLDIGYHGHKSHEEWFEQLPLVVALRDRVENASSAQLVAAEAKQLARNAYHQVTGSWPNT